MIKMVIGVGIGFFLIEIGFFYFVGIGVIIGGGIFMFFIFGGCLLEMID